MNEGQVFLKNIVINSKQSIAVTICWTDPAGVANTTGDIDQRTARLLNNLDLKITKDATVYFPWKLDVDSPQSPATQNSDNNVDNIEKILIENAGPGTYTIKVNHKGVLTNGLQEFSLIATAATGLNLSNIEFDVDNLITIYPNPTHNYFEYDLPSNFEVKSITIYDSSGKLVKTIEDLSQKSVQVSKLESGMYFFNFNGAKKSIPKKFIKN